jgi:ATP-dependent DNA helicase RecG
MIIFALKFRKMKNLYINNDFTEAVYHKGYDMANPVEVQIWQDKMTILSYPGPLPPVDFQILQHKKIEARNYRNRRIGDFLKELDLTEGRGSGFPKMYREMKKNGSQEPVIYTDEDSILFLTTLPAHPLSIDEVSKEVTKEVTKEVENAGPFAKNILAFLKDSALSRKEILDKLNMSNQTKNKERHIDPLMNYGWIAYTIPKNPKDMNQKYQLTDSGENLLKLLNNKSKPNYPAHP